MHLKSFIRKSVEDNIEFHEKESIEGYKSLECLNDTNTDNANYHVILTSSWKNEGEKSVERNHKGKLEDAVKQAEVEFKQVNNRSDVQAEYDVKIVLGNREYEVPKEYWEQFKEKRQ